jgi:hypothetical protein
LASVLVISANRRLLSQNTLVSASAAARRLPSSGDIRKLSVGSIVSAAVSPSTSKRKPVIVSLKSRLQAPWAVIAFSWNRRSSCSSSW